MFLLLTPWNDPMGQTAHQVLGIQYKPSPIANAVEMIHIVLNTEPMALVSPHAM